eukprot:354628-Pelagomonas_calceolata.AAC.3
MQRPAPGEPVRSTLTGATNVPGPAEATPWRDSMPPGPGSTTTPALAFKAVRGQPPSRPWHKGYWPCTRHAQEQKKKAMTVVFMMQQWQAFKSWEWSGSKPWHKGYWPKAIFAFRAGGEQCAAV